MFLFLLCESYSRRIHQTVWKLPRNFIDTFNDQWSPSTKIGITLFSPPITGSCIVLVMAVATVTPRTMSINTSILGPRDTGHGRKESCQQRTQCQHLTVCWFYHPLKKLVCYLRSMIRCTLHRDDHAENGPRIVESCNLNWAEHN